MQYDNQQNIASYQKFNGGVVEESYSFDYDENNQLIYAIREAEGSNDDHIQFSYEDNKLDEVIRKVDVNGQLINYRLQKYSYTGNTIQIDFYSSSALNVHSLILTEEYDTYDRLIKNTFDWQLSDNFTVDSLIYNEKGNLEKIYNVNYTDPLDIVTKERIYISDESESFENILSPARLYNLFKQISNYNLINPDYYAVFYGNKVETAFNNIHALSFFYSVLSSTRNERLPAESISIFPNPTKDFINIDIDKTITSFEIYDRSGRLIMQKSDSSNTIDVSQLINGLYTIVFADRDDKYYFSQFIKQ